MTATITAPSARSRLPLQTVLSTVTGRAAAPLVGVLAAIISAVGAGNPSYWGDEAASVLAAQRPIPILIGMLGHIDAVHGLYYLFLHVWVAAFGSAEALVRFPSAIAIGVAAAGTVVLARGLFGRSTGITAGLVFALIPQVTRMGAEARSYAFGMAAAVWLTVWFVALVRRRDTTRRSWVLYAVASAAALYLFLYLGMLLVVHAVWMLGQRPGKAVVRAWILSLLGALVLAAPIMVAAIGQREQIAFLARRDYTTLQSVTVSQWFASPSFAVLAWGLIVLAPIGVLVARGAHLRSAAAERRGLAMVVTWLVAPTALLIAGNALVTPMYNLRYVAFCTPAVAVMMALGLRTAVRALAGSSRAARGIDRTVATVIGVIIIAVVAAPSIIEQRGPFGKDGGSDLRQTAEVIEAHASPGDAIVFDQSVKPSRRSRLALDLYPGAFAGLDDVALATSYRDRPALWDRVAPLSELHQQLASHTVVWVIEGSTATPDVTALRALGYEVERSIPVHRSVVFELIKG
ncbi:MAG TPA: glycosyltransferase family 39 protein [Plantibacter sp.]|uniref:glycosyltransferase family 39 protein n=1 Tax=unclassified Plantibacter TaxID=2624265 RepID=UPI002BEAC11B|nr:glycosyltransferase family 39 protein [Plantibacter sp.]